MKLNLDIIPVDEVFDMPDLIDDNSDHEQSQYEERKRELHNRKGKKILINYIINEQLKAAFTIIN